MFLNTIHDLRLGTRTLVRAPGVTLMVVLALGLGIGANTAIFSVVNGVLLHALPYERADGLVLIWEDTTRRGGTARVPVAAGNFHSWRSSNPVFADMAALANASFRLTSVEQPVRTEFTPNGSTCRAPRRDRVRLASFASED